LDGFLTWKSPLFFLYFRSGMAFAWLVAHFHQLCKLLQATLQFDQVAVPGRVQRMRELVRRSISRTDRRRVEVQSTRKGG
jgi:hypothetical protein